MNINVIIFIFVLLVFTYEFLINKKDIIYGFGIAKTPVFQDTEYQEHFIALKKKYEQVSTLLNDYNDDTKNNRWWKIVNTYTDYINSISPDTKICFGNDSPGDTIIENTDFSSIYVSNNITKSANNYDNTMRIKFTFILTNKVSSIDCGEKAMAYVDVNIQYYLDKYIDDSIQTVGWLDSRTAKRSLKHGLNKYMRTIGYGFMFLMKAHLIYTIAVNPITAYVVEKYFNFRPVKVPRTIKGRMIDGVQVETYTSKNKPFIIPYEYGLMVDSDDEADDSQGSINFVLPLQNIVDACGIINMWNFIIEGKCPPCTDVPQFDKCEIPDVLKLDSRIYRLT